MSTHKSILRSTAVVSFATFCSRILGFIRDVVIARLFGVYVYAEAFVIAFKIPNLLRDFVGEGATNAAFVPVFSEYITRRSKEEFWELCNVVLNLLLIVLMAITILGILFSPIIVRLIAPGFMADPGKLATTIKLTRILFPYILLISLAAYAMAILNSLRHFSIPALSPCLLNISMIIFALLFGEGIKGLSLGVLVGGLLQLLIQVPVLYQKGFRLHLFKRFRHPAAGLIGRLMLPRFFSSCIYQLNNFVDSIFGSLVSIVGEGGVAALYFAYRLVLFPLGIFSTALAQVILPALSTQALQDNYAELKRTLSFGLRATFFVMLPASVGLLALAYPIISTIFRGGRFDTYSTIITANVLFFYSIGLFAYSAKRILQSCFFALKDTLTPAKVALLSLVLNITLNAILIFPMKLGGIALATSLSGIVTFCLLFLILKKKIGDFDIDNIIDSFLRILAAGLSMGAFCYLFLYKYVMQTDFVWEKFLRLGLSISLAGLSYILFCFVFRVEELRELCRWLYTRK